MLTYIAAAGAGARVCSPPAKLRRHLFVLQTTILHQQKEFMIDNYGILCCFVYHCGVCKTVGRILIISEDLSKLVKH